MAQEQPKRPSKEEEMMKKEETNSERFRFNAQAPEFVPRTKTQMPVSGYFHPCFHILGGSADSPDWLFVEDHDPPSYWISNLNISLPNNSSKNALPDDLQHKIIKQVEYQFSDTSLLANETLAKHTSKDPQGYVPISVIASTKKIKSLTTNNNVLAQALRSSSKLAVSNDGKKVKRKHPFTEKDREGLQSRTVVAENLPEDHSHQNLEKIFRVAGSVKTVRVCHPQESNSSRSKGDFLVSNKLHALVEYDTTEMAETAVEKLNDERNWRKGLRVRLLLRCSPKSVLKNRRSEFDGILDADDAPLTESAEDAFHSSQRESITETNGEESSTGQKKGWGRVRGKAQGRASNHIGRGLLAPSPQSSNGNQGEVSPKQSPKGPRMPDGTRGFTMGRGKPLRT
ncbi:La-related protein 7 [Morus notabilis]|uniref:La-related protein 7 n=1 Tax=Morus notabilis TaxID=981085 RepID=W9S6D8_9ROSA|nr:la-related protein 6C [Morus notabilis]EXC17385.1 La-related protein 7 [Morus notabilis]